MFLKENVPGLKKSMLKYLRRIGYDAWEKQLSNGSKNICNTENDKQITFRSHLNVNKR